MVDELVQLLPYKNRAKSEHCSYNPSYHYRNVSADV